MNTLENIRALSDSDKGSLGLTATAVVVAWRVYRLPLLQRYIPEKMRWSNLTPGVQWALTIAGAGVGGVLTALATGKSGWELVGAALRAIKDVLLA